MEIFRKGILNVRENTSLKGRWEKVSNKPLIIADVWHNEEGFKEVVSEIKKINKIALLPGSGTDFIDEVLNQVDAYITGDISYHHFLLADIAKIGLVQISHIASEIPGIDKFCRDLAKLIKINLTYHKPIFYG